MRTQAICLAVAIVLYCSIALAQWEQQDSGTTRDLLGVYFTDANTGTVVGDSGTILRTTNGGVIWSSQQSGTNKYLTGVTFVDFNTGTVVGDSGTILRTTTGGLTWLPQSSGSTLPLRGVCFTDARHGTVIGGWSLSGIILHTTDGGMTWMKQFETDSACLNSVAFTDSNTGTVVGGGWDDVVPNWHLILRTTDGGATWTIQNGPYDDILKSVSFTDPNTGTAVGGVWGSGDIPYSSYLILRTTDAGATWMTQKKATRAGNGFNCVFFTDANTGTVVGHLGHCSDGPRLDNILRTTDGGATWTPQQSGTTKVLWGVYFTDANIGTVVGSGGTILRTTNGGISSVEQRFGPLRYLLSPNYPNPFNPSTTIRYELPHASPVSLKVFNTLGQEVATLVSEAKPAGVFSVPFDAGSRASGVYFYRLQAGNFVETRKMLLVR